MNRLMHVRVWEYFDNFFFAPVSGYRDAKNFYEQASAVNLMPGIHIPVLLLNARSDTILSPECTPVWLAEKQATIYVGTPSLGGHVGFVLPRNPCTYFEHRALAFARETLG